VHGRGEVTGVEGGFLDQAGSAKGFWI
jgi:hypothetical protein